jgi:hypothetical protein
MYYLNEEVNCTETFPLVSVPGLRWRGKLGRVSTLDVGMHVHPMHCTGNTNTAGRISTVYLPIKVVCFVKK